MKYSVLEEAFNLSEEILKNLELSELPLTNIALKTSRLARLLGDYEYQKIFQYEASGYPTTPDGVNQKIFKLNQKAKRTYFVKVEGNENLTEYANLEPIEQYENELATAKESIAYAKDADVSLSSANPAQYVSAPFGIQ